MLRPFFLFALFLAACGGQQKHGGTLETVNEFECHDRTVGYMMTGGFVAPETGVTVSCSGDRVKLETWRVTDKQGTRKEAAKEMSQYEFEELWKKIDSAGWHNLEDCDNPDAADDDPVYTIDVSDDTASVSLSCQGKELPFPYDRLVNELDLKAAGFTQ